MPARFVWILGLAALAILRWRQGKSGPLLLRWRQGRSGPPALAIPRWRQGRSGAAALRVLEARDTPGPSEAGRGDPAKATPAITIAACTAPARAAFVLLGLYCLCVWGLHALAVHNTEKEIQAHGAGSDVHRLALIPRPMDPFHWNVLYESRGEIIAGKVPVWSRGAPALPAQRFKMNLERPEVQQALRTEEGQTALRFCRYLFANLNQTPLGLTVILRDARFTIRDTHEFSTFVIPVKQGARQGALSSEIPPHRGDTPPANPGLASTVDSRGPEVR
jgi:hypothetical protein